LAESPPELAREIGLLSQNAIVVVASDHGLRRSLKFALEVEGFRVTACDSWTAAGPLAASALGLVVDSDILRRDGEARTSLLAADVRLVLLEDGMKPPLEQTNAKVLTKPFQGADLVAAIDLMLHAKAG
jgi:DNA-binding response OmpR family regulator